MVYHLHKRRYPHIDILWVMVFVAIAGLIATSLLLLRQVSDKTLISATNYTLKKRSGIVLNDGASYTRPETVITGSSSPGSAAAAPTSQAAVKKSTPAVVSKVVFSDAFSGSDRIVTNEFSHFSPSSNCPYKSSIWEMTSGTLLVKNGAGYSGIPTEEPTSLCESAIATNSSVFRLNTKSHSYANAVIALDYKLVAHGNGGVAAESYDGIHVWSRYQSQYSLYVSTISRWDGNIVIKKKVPLSQAGCSDPANDGCYYTISLVAHRSDLSVPGSWHHAEVVTLDEPGGKVHIAVFIDGSKVVEAIDSGQNGAVYHSGAVGVRGDNTEFYIKNFVVSSS